MSEIQAGILKASQLRSYFWLTGVAEVSSGDARAHVEGASLSRAPREIDSKTGPHCSGCSRAAEQR